MLNSDYIIIQGYGIVLSPRWGWDASIKRESRAYLTRTQAGRRSWCGIAYSLLQECEPSAKLSGSLIEAGYSRQGSRRVTRTAAGARDSDAFGQGTGDYVL